MSRCQLLLLNTYSNKNIYITLYIYSVIEYVKFRHIVIYFTIRYYIRKLIIN